MNTQHFGRRDFLRLGGITIGSALLSPLHAGRAQDQSEGTQPFFTGMNYPWIAYGHDFGKNGWGHDGLITNGWTYQTWSDSMGFTDTRRTSAKAKTGKYSLAVTADLIGGHASKSKGEVYVDLTTHHPRGVKAPVNLTNTNAHFWVWLPQGSAGSGSAPNGIQIIFKSQASADAPLQSYYGKWENIQPAWEGNWHEFIANPSDNDPGYKDAMFDAARIVAIGLKMAISPSSKATVNGVLYLDSVQLDTSRRIRFDFETLEIEEDFDELQCGSDVLRVFVCADGGASPEFLGTGAIANPGYEKFLDEEVFPWLPCSALGLDKPCFVGEVPTASTTRIFRDYLDAARNGGYSGLLGWSYRAQDDYSNFQNAKQYLKSRCLFMPTLTR